MQRQLHVLQTPDDVRQAKQQRQQDGHQQPSGRQNFAAWIVLGLLWSFGLLRFRCKWCIWRIHAYQFELRHINRYKFSRQTPCCRTDPQ